MESIRDYLTDEHRRCDTLYAELEMRVQQDEWERAEDIFMSFQEETLAHFKKEEEVLFPEFEENTGITMGPTQVMRMEHSQAKELLKKMKSSLEKRNKEGFLSVGDTLMILIQQHNMKEEQILYPMCDQHLDSSKTIEKMESL
ncbi:MAG: hemerythrin domain-containing protein [Aquificaceae bacterium]